VFVVFLPVFVLVRFGRWCGCLGRAGAPCSQEAGGRRCAGQEISPGIFGPHHHHLPERGIGAGPWSENEQDKACQARGLSQVVARAGWASLRPSMHDTGGVVLKEGMAQGR
jgi:hypothetical protein